MSSMPGGAADKFGNRFEHWWTAFRIADVLEGRASTIRLEPPGPTGFGIEFTVEEKGTAWAEQVKEVSSGGNWTVNRLKNKEVLQAAKAHVESGRNFRLVASTAAPEITDLSARARATETLAEFNDALSKDLLIALADVASIWSTTSESTWTLLKRIYVTHHTPDSMKSIARAEYKLLFSNDPDSTIAELRDYCDENIHLTLNAVQIWAHLESKGFNRRHLVGDHGTISSLRRTLDRQERRVNRSAPRIGLVRRHDAEQILNLLQAPDAKQVLVVDGLAGCGKSTIVTEVTRSLEGLGWFVAVARMDSVETKTNTSDKLGQAIGLTESPATLLSAVAATSPCVLVIDQLDAVSTYGGRMADSFESIDEILDELASIPNLKVVLVVRTVDLESDPRLRRLVTGAAVVDRHTIGRLDIADVKNQLISSGLAVHPNELTLELLRTPLHFAVFSRLSDSSRALSYRTLQNLYDQYTDEVRHTTETRVGHIDWLGITNALVDYMNRNEVLSAPTAVLDGAVVAEVRALESESVIGRDDYGFSFFHESYFDYLFARSFVASGDDLHAFLSTSGQYLFRRAQTRQILEHLAATDRTRFREITSQLLYSTEIRSHLKDVVVTVLSQLDPVAEDWVAIDSLAWSGEPIGAKLLTLLSSPGWFDAADSEELWASWLADPDRVDRAFHQLAFAARRRPARAESLVRPYVGTSKEWRFRLRFLIEWSLTPELTNLAIDLVNQGLLDDARGPIASNSDFWSIVYGLKRIDSAAAARLIGAHLQRSLTRAKENGVSDPFASEYLQVHSQGSTVIIETAEAAPSDFLDHVLPFIIDVSLAEQRPRPPLLSAGIRWHIRYQNANHGVDSAVFAGAELALRTLAAEDSSKLPMYLDPIQEQDSDELRFLACRALATTGLADTAVSWLLSDVRNFSIGWTDSPRWASRELIEVCSPACSNELFARLERTVLGLVESTLLAPPTEYGQFELLSAMEPARLSEHARRRLHELERQFPGSAPEPPRGIVATVVGSPIGDESSTKMGDADWLRALSKHTADETTWRGHGPVGGARQLAQVLSRRAEEDPDRFARLVLEFDSKIPAAAFEAIISSVAGKVDIDLFSDVCKHATKQHEAEVGRAVCGAIRNANISTSTLAELVRIYSLSPDPDHEAARTESKPGEYYHGGDLYFAGINSTRGQAAEAAASILFVSDEQLPSLLSVIEELATDKILAVRACAAQAVIAVMNHDPDRAFDIAQRLLNAPLEVLDTRSTERLLTYAVVRRPEQFTATLELALAGPEAVAQRAGRAWAVVALNDVDPLSAAATVHQLSVPARRGAAQVIANQPYGLITVLKKLFDDADESVRAASSQAVRGLEALEYREADELVRAFTLSAAFAENFNHLIGTLESMTTPLPPSTIAACERAVEVAGTDLGNISTARALTGQLLITVVLRLYRQGDEDMRIRCLDLVDRLSEINAYGVTEALRDER